MNTTMDRTAVRDMTPIVLGLMPFGLLIGLTISTHRAGRAGGLGSAALIFGGTAHLSALTLITAGAGPLTVLAGVLVINSRLLLYAAALQPRFTDQPTWFRWLGPACDRPDLALPRRCLPGHRRALRRYCWTAARDVRRRLGTTWSASAPPPAADWLPLTSRSAVLFGLLVPHLKRRLRAVSRSAPVLSPHRRPPADARHHPPGARRCWPRSWSRLALRRRGRMTPRAVLTLRPSRCDLCCGG